uniref:carnosine N-methyltransferase n=1 Tax=Ciona intestinalis TaxID=7719 RepID=F6S0S0_CIOIN|nr:carnosine N-methyltransferase [Ciona intestinalis]|eukprot:XP_002129866.1 carnosine N-methyltransferase [Ciona intestinalis]
MESNETNSKPMDKDEMEEVLHYMRVVHAFKAYRSSCLRQLEQCEKNFRSLSVAHQEMLPDHLSTIDEAKVCVDVNAALITEITNYCGNMFENKEYREIKDCHIQPTSFDLDKVKSTLKQIVRDWSVDGAEERDLCYRPIIEEILKRKPPNTDESTSAATSVSILVPGCGLGRLAWELANRGYFCQGNEFSFYMLFTSHFIINRTQGDTADDYHQYTVHPWIDKRCNNISWKHALKGVQFPDINPGCLSFKNRFSIAAGDFLEVYTDEAAWDCVATCYFIDTAHNIISYIERIYHILKPGGVWVNLGPLLYHFYGVSNESSVELSYEEVVGIVEKVGFQIKKSDWLKGHYTHNPHSMLRYEYTCAFLVAEKP